MTEARSPLELTAQFDRPRPVGATVAQEDVTGFAIPWHSEEGCRRRRPNDICGAKRVSEKRRYAKSRLKSFGVGQFPRAS
jgi:hypothetical protein